MQGQVILLKKKIRTLETQLCDRTRNYLYHFKKSPAKSISTTCSIEVQTDITLDGFEYIINLSAQKPFIQQRVREFSVNQDDDQHFKTENKTSQHRQEMQKVSKIIQQQQKSLKQSQEKQQKIDWDHMTLDKHLLQQNQQHINDINNLTSQIRNIKQQLQNSKSPKSDNLHRNIFQSGFKSKDSEVEEYKIQSNRLGDSQYQKQKDNLKVQLFPIKTDRPPAPNNSSLSHSPSVCSHRSIDQIREQIGAEHHEKQMKILKDQVKKLKDHLQYQIKLSGYTKEGLLISEEENYKFRLEIQDLKKQLQILTSSLINGQISSSEQNIADVQQPLKRSQISSLSEETKQQLEKFKSQNQQYQQLINHLQGVKADYLNKCIQGKQQIFKLKQQNQKLKAQLNDLKAALLDQQQVKNKQQKDIINTPQKGQAKSSSPKLSKVEEKWVQLFKSKVHQISNCLPLSPTQELFVFRPETVQELVAMLDRILQFCLNIQGWERQKIQLVQKQRSNLLMIISNILMKFPSSKNFIAEQISQIKELRHLVNFLNRDLKQQENRSPKLQPQSPTRLDLTSLSS